MSFTLVSFYTESYADYASRLRASAVEWNVPAFIVPIPSAGKWVQNCAHKAEFLFACLKGGIGPILWVDADAEIKQRLEFLEDFGGDFGVRKREGRMAEKCGPFMSGTLYLKPTVSVLRMVDRWRSLEKETWDQITLYRAWQEFEIRTEWLPKSYCQKFDDKRGDPVIVHYMGSRKLKRAGG